MHISCSYDMSYDIWKSELWAIIATWPNLHMCFPMMLLFFHCVYEGMRECVWKKNHNNLPHRENILKTKFSPLWLQGCQVSLFLIHLSQFIWLQLCVSFAYLGFIYSNCTNMPNNKILDIDDTTIINNLATLLEVRLGKQHTLIQRMEMLKIKTCDPASARKNFSKTLVLC